jgi:hypothetical protein
MPRRLTALAFVLAGANAALADNMKMPTDSGISNGVQHRPYCRKEQKSLFCRATLSKTDLTFSA